MASKGKKSPRKAAIAALQDITRAKPHPNDLWGVIMEAEDSLVLEGLSTDLAGTLAGARLQKMGVQTMPDATFALVISTAVDQALELAISTHFDAEEDVISLIFDGNANGPLADFTSRIKMGRALGIYPAVIKEELDLIRHIRNAFAHSWDKLEFTDKAVTEASAQLHLPYHFKQNPLKQPPVWTPKNRYLYSARVLYSYLEWGGRGNPVRYATHPGRKMFEDVQAASERAQRHQSGQ
jgi:DNA-binding MltR family transcriptional regulator